MHVSPRTVCRIAHSSTILTQLPRGVPGRGVSLHTDSPTSVVARKQWAMDTIAMGVVEWRRRSETRTSKQPLVSAPPSAATPRRKSSCMAMVDAMGEQMDRAKVRGVLRGLDVKTVKSVTSTLPEEASMLLNSAFNSTVTNARKTANAWREISATYEDDSLSRLVLHSLALPLLILVTALYPPLLRWAEDAPIGSRWRWLRIPPRLRFWVFEISCRQPHPTPTPPPHLSHHASCEPSQPPLPLHPPIHHTKRCALAAALPSRVCSPFRICPSPAVNPTNGATG
jgi:hypothetical protein